VERQSHDPLGSHSHHRVIGRWLAGRSGLRLAEQLEDLPVRGPVRVVYRRVDDREQLPAGAPSPCDDGGKQALPLIDEQFHHVTISFRPPLGDVVDVVTCGRQDGAHSIDRLEAFCAEGSRCGEVAFEHDS
jgi:hypothetical protein